jgi:hypothetical protein
MPEGLNNSSEDLKATSAVPSSLPDINTPPNATEGSSVSDFYSKISEQVNPQDVSQLQESSLELNQAEQNLKEIDTRITQTEEELQNTGPFQFQKKRMLNEQKIEQGKAYSENANQRNVSQAEVQSSRQNLTHAAENIGIQNENIPQVSNETIVRSLNPQRLEELAIANEANTTKRVADLTPQEVNQRREAVKEQKRQRIKEYERVVAEKITTRLSQELQEYNQSITERYRGTEKKALWKTDINNIQPFVERACNKKLPEDPISIDEAEKGYWELRDKVRQFEYKHNKTREEINEMDYLTTRSKKVGELQKEILVPMVIWQMGDEFSQNIGTKGLSADKFLYQINRISENWERNDSTKPSFYSEKCRKYRQSLPIERRIDILSQFPRSYLNQETYYEGILQDITDISGKRTAAELSLEDIPTIFAYFDVALEKGIDQINYQNLSLGISAALQHVIKNPENINIPAKDMEELVLKMRNRDEIHDIRNPDFQDIVRTYSSMMYDTRDHDTFTNFNEHFYY